MPAIWDKSGGIRCKLLNTTDEYATVLKNFDNTMEGQYAQIVRIERIQNEEWYVQYLAHSQAFEKRLHEATERLVYHGCPEEAANSIIEKCFNRSFAGVNGRKIYSLISI